MLIILRITFAYNMACVHGAIGLLAEVTHFSIWTKRWTVATSRLLHGLGLSEVFVIRKKLGSV